MNREALRETLLMIAALAVFLLLLVVPHVFFAGGRYWIAAFLAVGALVYLMYEYHGAAGFAFVPDMMAMCVSMNSVFVFVASTGAIFRANAVSWWLTVPATALIALVVGFLLFKIDPLLKRLHRMIHKSKTSS